MISEILKKFKEKRVLVLGDVMLDHYVWGRVERISPEAPVPVLEVQNEESRLGGAANVALNLRSLGAEILLIGVTGNDRTAQMLKELLQKEGLGGEGLVGDSQRSTTIKTRIGAVNQQIVRIDYESKNEISELVRGQLMQILEKQLPGCDGMIIEDYNKGLLSADLISTALHCAKANGVTVAVDPKHKNFLNYRGVDIFKPNYTELQTILGKVFEDEAAFYTAANELRREMDIRNLIVTRGSKGMYIFSGGEQPMHLPTAAREVYDVSGAGDTVISAITLAYISGADIHMAAEIANHAAGVVCGIKGTAKVSKEDILTSYNDQR